MDVVVTVPKTKWDEWIREGALPGETADPNLYYFFTCGGVKPAIKPGERVYIVAHGKLRGYAPLIDIEEMGYGQFALVRQGGAVACTIETPIPGFRGWRYRHWEYDQERPFPEWKTP